MWKFSGILAEDIIMSEKMLKAFSKWVLKHISFLWLQGMLVATPNRQVFWGQIV